MKNTFGFLVAVLLLQSTSMAEPPSDGSERYPLSLFEVSPSLGFLQQTFPVNSAPSGFWSSANPGLNLRFNPQWRGKFPIQFQLGGIRVTEQNSNGFVVVGEHDNVKYLWNFGAKFGFFPLDSHRLLVSGGMEFNHEAFLRDLGGGQVHLNKVWLQSLVGSFAFEWLRSPQYSALLEAGMKAVFSLPMDAYLIRNGLVSYAKTSVRWKADSYQVFAGVLVENRWQDTTLGKTSQVNVALELGLGWGGGQYDGL